MQEAELGSLRKENSALADHNRLLVQKNNTLLDENQRLREDLEMVIGNKQTMQSELEQCTDFIAQMEEKVYKSNKISLELLSQLQNAQLEIEELQQMLVSIRKKITVYAPAKNDPIDKRLSEYINSAPMEHLKILFLRQNEGIYMFGSKRVNLKLEKNEIKVRTGGGYLSLDEFVAQNVNVELEKLDKLSAPISGSASANYGGKTVTGLGTIPESPALAGAGGRRSQTRLSLGGGRLSSTEQRERLISSLGGYHQVDE